MIEFIYIINDDNYSMLYNKCISIQHVENCV